MFRIGCGKNDQWRVAQAIQEINAIDVRHFDIQKNEVGFMLL
jgi:hypothetical protein